MNYNNTKLQADAGKKQTSFAYGKTENDNLNLSHSYPNTKIKLEFGINRKLYNKQRQGDDTPHWETKEGTVKDIAEAVINGHGFMTGVLNGKRTDQNVVSFGAIALDIDDGLSLEDALEHSFIKKYCGLIYTSASHQKAKQKHGSEKWIEPRDRYRLVFVLPEKITDLSLWNYLYQIVAENIPEADPSCKNIGRYFYGNTGTNIPLLDETICLPEMVVEEAIALRDVDQATKNHKPQPKPRVLDDWDKKDTRELAEQALQFIPQRQPGGNNYHECLRVLMALHSEFGSDAIAIAESWSPSIPGTTWDIEKKIRSFERTAQTGVSIGTLFHIAKQYGFEMPKSKATGKGVSSGFVSSRNDNTTTEGNENLDIKAEIHYLADSNLSKSELNLKINELSKQSGFIPSELRRMYEARLQEVEKENAIADTKSELETLLKLESANLNLSDHVDDRLAKPLGKIADILGTREEAFLTTLLPTVASLTTVGTSLELIKATGFYALPIIYSGIVGESGTSKSPTQKTILKPLFELQNIYDDEYNSQCEEWLAECKTAKENDQPEPPKPERTEVWTSDATSEAIALIQSNQPDDGFVLWKDELSALIKDNNSYRGGKGSDAEKLLSGRDGTGIKVNRAGGKRLSVKQSAYSITGGTQPDTLRKQIDFDDPTGHWARFLWCLLPLKQNTFPRNAPDIDISELLLSIYKQIKSFPAYTYKLSSPALDTFADWYDLLEKRKYNETRQGLRAVYSKAKNDTGIIALLLHILNAAIDGTTPDDKISNDTMKSAIAITKFYLSQVRLIHSDGDAETGEDNIAPLYRKILELSDRQGWVSARDVSRSSSSFRKHKPDDIRCLFRELESMGMAKLAGEGTKLKLSSLSSTVVKLSSMDDDNIDPTNNGSSSQYSQSVVNGTGFNFGETVVSEDNSVAGKTDDDKTQTVVNEKNTEETMTTMTTESSQSQSQQGLEVNDSLTTKPTTEDDSVTTDDKKTMTDNDKRRSENQPHKSGECDEDGFVDIGFEDDEVTPQVPFWEEEGYWEARRKESRHINDIAVEVISILRDRAGNPLKKGIPKDELTTRVAIAQQEWEQILRQNPQIKVIGKNEVYLSENEF